MNGTQVTTESINTNNWPIRTSVQNRMHNSGCGRCETKTTATNYLENSGKYIVWPTQPISVLTQDRREVSLRCYTVFA